MMRVCIICCRPKASICRVSAAARSAALETCSSGLLSGLSGVIWRSISSVDSLMTTRTLLKSWAIPPAKPAHRLQFLHLPHLLLQRALLGHVLDIAFEVLGSLSVLDERT